MTVYVDPLQKVVPNDRWRWDQSCHLVADTVPELVTFARRIGCRADWLQRTSLPHFDLTALKRQQAVAAGAIDLKTVSEAGHLFRNLRRKLIGEPTDGDSEQGQAGEVDHLDRGQPDRRSGSRPSGGHSGARGGGEARDRRPPEYSKLPFVPYVPPQPVEPEPEPAHWIHWRCVFVAAGLTIASRPYQTPDGPHFCGWIWKCDKGPGNFAVDLERGTWSECGTLTRDRPAAELADRVAELRAAAEKADPAGTKAAPAETIATPVETPPPRAPAPEPAPAANIPRAIPALDPAAAAWLEECRGKGIEIEATPWNQEGNSFRGWYRGRDMTLHLNTRGVLYGVKIPNGRSWRPFTVDMVLEAIEDELAGRPVDEVQTLITTPQLTTQPPPAAAEPVRPSVDRPQQVQVARPRPGDGPREFVNRQPIPRIGGILSPGCNLILVSEHPAHEAMTPNGEDGYGWVALTILPRGNFRTADRRTVSDYPLNWLEPVEWLGVIESIRPPTGHSDVAAHP